MNNLADSLPGYYGLGDAAWKHYCKGWGQDDDEFINVELIKLDKLVDMVMAGEIADAKTQLAILKADKYLKNHLD